MLTFWKFCPRNLCVGGSLMTSGWRLSIVTAAAGLGMMTLPMLAPGSSDDETNPNGKSAGTLLNPGKGNGNSGQAKGKPGGGGGGATNNGITYHGGPVMLNTVNVYFIWYGNWSGNTATTILPALVNGISGSPYFNINTTYYDGAGNHVSGFVQHLTDTNDNYSSGTKLTDSSIPGIVSRAITSHALPMDNNGAYFVLTSADVAESSG